MANIDGTISGTGTTSTVALYGDFTISLEDFGSATIILERSFDGTNFYEVKTYTGDMQENGTEPGKALSGNSSYIQYRLNCTLYGSGTITYYLGN